MTIRDEILNSGFVKDGQSNGRKAQNPIYKGFIARLYSEFNILTNRDPVKLSEALYCLFHDFTPAICHCGKETKFIDFKNGYQQNCSSRCAALNPVAQEKLKNTTLERYGVDNISKLPENIQKFKENTKDRTKARATMLERYGAETTLQSKELRDKVKETTKIKYGVDHPMKSEIFMDKLRATNLERRGVEYATQDSSVIEKSKQTNLTNFGVENSMQREEIKEKARNTWINKYGVAHPMKCPEVVAGMLANNVIKYGVESTMLVDEFVDKMTTNNVDKYGVRSTAQIHYSDLAREILFDIDKFKDFVSNKSLSNAASILMIDNSTVGKYCSKYGIEVEPSSFEVDIAAFLKTIGVNFFRNTRSVIKPKELDFYLPEFRLAIEFNGLYWHSDAKIGDKNYHLKKFCACRDQNIRLLSINEDEWIERSEIIKNRIKNICGLTDKGIAARKLKLSVISNKMGNEFVDQYHIQGASSGVLVSYGAFDADKLVGVIQFSKQRTTGDIELIRFCSDNYTHAGMFSKMFKYAISDQGYTKIISFADHRYSLGDMYEKNGFEKTKVIPPDYRYVKNLKTFHKSLFTKSLIQKKFGIDMSNLTEREAMTKLGYMRIYDSGKIRYEYNVE